MIFFGLGDFFEYITLQKDMDEKKYMAKYAELQAPSNLRTCEHRHENVYWFLRIQNAIKDLVKLSIMSMNSR